MAYIVQIIDNESNEAYDVSELAYDITHFTSLQGQAGKLTFNLRKDPNNILQLSIGSVVRFYNDDVPVFYGYIFTLKTNRQEVYQVVAYDQMRYLQNHNYLFMKDMNLVDVFKQVCIGEKIKNYAILGKAKTLNASNNLEPYHFNDVSDFDLLQHCINETNVFVTKKTFEEKTKTLSVGATVNYIGGESYLGSNELLPASINRTAGTAVITIIKEGASHPYHIQGKTSNVYGWVDASSISLENDTAPLIDQNYYFIRDNFGILELNDIESNVKYRKTDIIGASSKEWIGNEDYRYNEGLLPELEPLIIGDESLLTDYDYELDIDKKTYNQIWLMDTVKDTSQTTNKKKSSKINSYAEQDDDSVKKWGVLRKIVNLKTNYTGADESVQKKIEEYVKLSLLEGAQINKTLKIEALGYNGVNAGDGFLLELKKLNVKEMMYVISATHHYDADKHTMSLEVSTSKNLCEVLK